MKPRFRAEWEVLNEEFYILASWFLSPMSKNSVFEELGTRVRCAKAARLIEMGLTHVAQGTWTCLN